MKITIDESKDYKEPEIIIRCGEVDAEIITLLSSIRTQDKKVIGMLDNKIHVIDPHDILYFESVDKKTFVYTKNEVFETALRLYEIEEAFKTHGFFRASKSSVVNVSKIKEISNNFHAKLDITLENGEKLTVSRQYVPFLKQILGF